MGSTVVRGEVEGTVEFTGANTFFGRTASLLQVLLRLLPAMRRPLPLALSLTRSVSPFFVTAVRTTRSPATCRTCSWIS
jgi:magnesium-transporting ATPase (P-type)